MNGIKIGFSTVLPNSKLGNSIIHSAVIHAGCVPLAQPCGCGNVSSDSVRGYQIIARGIVPILPFLIKF